MEDPAIGVVRNLLAENPKKTISDPSLIPAGVMLLLYPKDGEYCILLNKRTNHVEHHKGEISFPGGSKDEEDATLLDTALRETHEEMGIRPQDIDVLGELDDTPTNSRFLINAYVGTIPYPYDFKPSAIEVKREICGITLRFLASLRMTTSLVLVRCSSKFGYFE